MYDAETIRRNAISMTLMQHGLKAEAVDTIVGPTVTQYAFKPQGTPVKRFEAVSRDLAVALGLDEVRIVAPIPDTQHVGIEVPSIAREVVRYADIVEGMSADKMPTGGPLPFPVGVGVNNHPAWADLAELPHLLIAGATGSGKSVALNGLITSLIQHRTPDDVRLFLLDPKRVELSIFADAPHVEQVATDHEDMLIMLQDVVSEMDRRYSLFEDAGVRSIGEYNASPATPRDPGGSLSHWVVVADEMADLMMGPLGKAIEPMLVRLAQLARACGIHLVLATQRPIVSVITGNLKANIPSRWSFSVASPTDSMVILDQSGAQALYRNGDSLFLPAGESKPLRVQGAYIGTDEVRAIVADARIAYPDVESQVGLGAADEDDELSMDDLRPAEHVADTDEVDEASASNVDQHAEYEATLAAIEAAHAQELEVERTNHRHALAAAQQRQGHHVRATVTTTPEAPTRRKISLLDFGLQTAIVFGIGGTTVALVADFISNL